MNAPRPGADRLGTLVAAGLALLGLGAFDLLALPLVPTTAGGFLALAVPVLAVLLPATALAAAGPRPPALRALALVLGALPALLAASLLASGGTQGPQLPGLGLALALGVTLAFAAAPLRVRRAAAALLIAAWGSDVVLAEARLPLLPAALNPVRAPLLAWSAQGGSTSMERTARGAVRGLRPGAYVPAPDLGGAAGPWYRLADEGPVPRGTPIVRVLGPERAPAFERLTLPQPAGVQVPEGAGGHEVFVVREGALPVHPFDLGGVEVVRVDATSWPEGGQASVHAAALARYVRLGGHLLLVGPGDGPPGLAEALRVRAGPRPPDPRAARRWGQGAVWRARDDAEALVQLAAALAEPRLGTVFDGSALPPAPPGMMRPALERGRRPLGILLLGFACALALLEGGVRTLRGMGATLALPTLAVLGGIALLRPGGGDLAVGVLVVDLGGPGARRVEALWLEAGERGYAGRLGLGGSGLLRRAPGPWLEHPTRLGPAAAGWLVLEREAPEAEAAWREDRSAGWLRDLLVGEVAAPRLGFGRVPWGGLSLEGVALPQAFSLRVAPVE